MRNYFDSLRSFLRPDTGNIARLESSISSLSNNLEHVKISNGKMLSKMNLLLYSDEIRKDIRKSEFKVYSQWGDDGIINYLINYLDIQKKEFIEFGVESYWEANTRFLLVNDNWRGLIIDGSERNIEAVKQEDISWQFDLTAVCSFVNAENINDTISKYGFTGDIGLLHIDIDGNDYWVWKAIQVVQPIIVILEYNSVFGVTNPWTIPYNPKFNRTEAHFSNLYFGTSILSAYDLASTKGYDFIGCNSNGNNAYFVRRDKLKGLRPLNPEEGYVLSKFSESRDAEGRLTYIRNENRLKAISGLEVFNTRSGRMERVG